MQHDTANPTGDNQDKTVIPEPGAMPDDLPRRRFMQLIGAGAGLVAFGAHARHEEDDDYQWQWAHDRQGRSYERLFVLDPQFLFMNIGTAGSMPREVLRFFRKSNHEYARNSDNGYGSYGELRERIAPGFGMDPDELVVSYNTSDGMCHAILGIPWEPGDCVVTTNHEHPGGNVPLQIAADRYGLEIRRVALPVGNDQQAEDYVDLFRDAIKAAGAEGLNVRAMMWSSPTFVTGTMLPIRRLVDLAIEHGLITICDGAHLPGMMAYNYAELGLDFMSGAGHKWQCGPGSTGILAIRNKVRDAYNPLPLPPYFPVVTSSYSPTRPRIDGTGTVDWSDRATGPDATYDIARVIQSCGSKHEPMLNSLGRACDIWDEIGRQKIQDYVVGLGMALKHRIAEQWGVEALYAPMDDPELLSALTSFNPFIDPTMITDAEASSTFVRRLREEYGIIVRNTSVEVTNPDGFTDPDRHRPIRISTHLWHDKRDIRRVVDACLDLALAIHRGR